MKSFKFFSVFIVSLICAISGWGAADLQITKTVDNATPTVGNNVTFTIVGRNNGPDTTDIVINDTLPAGLTWVSDTDNGKNQFDCTNVGNAVTCTGSNNIDSGETVTINIVATVVSAGTITNTATIASTQSVADSNNANNSASVTLTATAPSADLSITKAVNNASPNVGDTVTFTLVGRNNGPSASQFNITDTLPAGLSYVSAAEGQSNFSCSQSGGTVTCSGTNSFASGASVTVTIQALVTAAGTLTNTAAIASNNGVTDPNGANNTASVSLTSTLLPPVITAGQAFSVTAGTANGATVGTVVTTGGTPTSFSISSAVFSISTSGVISVANSSLLGAAGTVHTLNVTASNAAGSDTKPVTITITAPITVSGSYRDFTLRKQLYTRGDMKTIGNTALVAPYDGVSESTNQYADCTTYTNGPYLINSTAANGDRTLCGYSVDGNQTNATTSELALPAGSTVIWAGLYWQGMMKTTINTNMKVNLRREGSSYVSISPDMLNYIDSGYNYDGTDGISYSAFADVTGLFGEGKWNEGNYTVSNVPVIEGGRGTGLGTYGAWSLVIIYEDPNDKYRSFSVFDGWKQVTSSTDAYIPISGFYTPNRTDITAKVSVFSAEGDLPYYGDQLLTKNYNTNQTVALETIANNTFNSSVTGGGVRTPQPNNNFGIDIQTFNIGNLLQPQQDHMEFTLTSSQDVYWPSMLAFTTELYEPKLCYDYSIKQDGRYLSLDRNTYPQARIDTAITASPVDVLIYLRNKEADFPAEGISILSDVNTSRFDYGGGSIYVSNPSGSTLIDRGVPVSSDPLCSYNINSGNGVADVGCTDGHNIRKGNGSLGSEAYIYTKFTLQPKEINGVFDDVNESLGMKIDYYITVNGTKIPYPGYTLGGANVPICTPSEIYQPAWGQFNVVQSGSTLNNINTQVSRKPFAVDVIFDSTPTTGNNQAPAADVNSTVFVEMIDVDSFGDINASCANPDAAVSSPIFVPIAFNNVTYQTTVPLQDSDYHNFALKNGAYRVWYFTDKNGVLRNWNVSGLSDGNKAITGISGLFDSASHGDCNSSCGVSGGSSTSLECFQCMKAYYAKPLCSRDNFSVRPEAFDIRLSDSNQGTGGAVQPLSDSDAYNYSPERMPAEGTRLKLAAGYNYRYDINATGYEDTSAGLAAVPRYTRYFSGARSDYNATMYWDPTTTKIGCNDTSNRSLTFFIQNGSKIDQRDKLSQVGEYRINMTDASWTAVDQIGLNAYRTALNGFRTVGGVVDDDCIGGTETTVVTAGKIGCTISSEHMNGVLYYKDQNATFVPYKFAFDGGFRIGEGNAATVPPNIPLAAGMTQFVYMADISNLNEMNMAVRGEHRISAQGADDITLTNFVGDCYATDVDLSLGRVHSVNQNLADYQARYSDYNVQTGLLLQNYNANVINPVNTGLLRTVDDLSFTKEGAGVLRTELRLNYDRSPSVLVNPITVTFNDYNANCTNPTECEHSADLDMAREPSGKALNGFDVVHYYGRAQGQYTRVRSPVGQNTAIGNARVNFEVFCGNDGVTNCNPTNVANPIVLPSGRIALRGEDRDWYLNLDHSDTDPNNPAVHNEMYFNPYGRADIELAVINAAEVTNQVTISEAEQNAVNGINVTATKTGFERYGVMYNGANGYPYSVRIQNNPSPWLIYNPPGDTNLLTNEYAIEFNKESNWIGESTSGQATDNDAAINTSRRIMW